MNLGGCSEGCSHMEWMVPQEEEEETDKDRDPAYLRYSYKRQAQPPRH
jgi:hypothetical protein